ncbi:ArsR/SmtB family transcription factor [Brevibacterium jeotgali]|uniref:ArsR family transcriptional regulator n=1 Tax=Brevibacterium jeotgali TaxID=1262550 RepID=A0A2H1L4E1_9MICO|nr:metalloregulator ArsR/SmtB family transcription factor [Brevibacterium jeotgali]TWB98637.1 ArsR family transcriptional regulator [Brevibacterium jeotgali]SMY11762.1 ArsR family transcriptional regulator [Brevibacterium jeotgali]
MPSIDSQRPLYEIKANLFKGLAHPFRIRILELLSEAHHDAARQDGSTVEGRAVDGAIVDGASEAYGELSVSDLLRETELEASHLSQHLAVLRRHRLVESQRRGSRVYYRLAHVRVARMLAVARQLLLDTLAADEKLLSDAGALPAVQALESRSDDSGEQVDG